MLSLRATLALLLIVPAISSPCQAQPKPEKPAPTKETAKLVDLRPKFKKGQEVRFVLKLESRDSGGEEGRQTNDTDMGILLRCTDTNAESGSKLDLAFESYKAKIHNGTLDVEFDSSKPEKPDDPFDSVLRSIVGLTLPMTIDKDGNVSDIGGASGLGDLLSGKATGADAVKSIFGPITTNKKSPGRVAVGESWTTEDTMQGAAGPMRIVMTHTVASHVGGKAIINSTGKVSLEPSSGAAGMPQIRLSDSQITGKTTWDTDLGMLTDMESRQKITVQTRSGNEPATSTTQEMNVRVNRKK